ncbi:TIGR03620 family F420-dependent LLM class oxidoreductase [Microlunatus speluncae]|uniref:TIGR03620 family F420-dependent LLM class oxidoreductase n=1 Tax=Microlunatus speluncae TaxID=2594267 RepID=UPI001266541D|nr:TIGR03620 family F420-dependent LLM class oxidoreductase [Microlunatus speluncae]
MELSRAGLAIDLADGIPAQAARYEELGYGALWIAGGQLTSLAPIGDLLAATRTTTVGTGIIPTSVYPAPEVIQTYADLERTEPGRFLVGLGGAQAPKSLQALHDYLDQLDRSDPVLPVDRRYLAALGPRKVELARDRFAGAITLLVTPDFTARTRDRLGSRHQIVDLLVAPDLDAERARAAARETLGFLVRVPGYRAHLTRIGFAETEIDRLDDWLVDAIVPRGDTATIAAAVRQHWDAGADQVIISPLGGTDRDEFLAELADLLRLPADQHAT